MQGGSEFNWQTLQPFYHELLNAVGSGNTVSQNVYNSLMENLEIIPRAAVLEYRRAVVDHLLSLVGTPYLSPQNLHPGDIIEESILGIPRRNNTHIGDLLGLELKSFSGSSPLTLTSFSCVRELVSQIDSASNIWDVVWFPTHQNHHNQTPSATHHLRANENLRHNTPGFFDNLLLGAFGDRMEWRFNPGGQQLMSRSLDEMFVKFNDGLLLLDITGTKSSESFTINGIYFAEDFTPNGIGQHFIDENIKFEIRYDLPNKVDGISQCTMPRNSGHAFRMTPATVRREVMTAANKINTISDFR